MKTGARAMWWARTTPMVLYYNEQNPLRMRIPLLSRGIMPRKSGLPASWALARASP